jgi:hypothetical protein
MCHHLSGIFLKVTKLKGNTELNVERKVVLHDVEISEISDADSALALRCCWLTLHEAIYKLEAVVEK